MTNDTDNSTVSSGALLRSPLPAAVRALATVLLTVIIVFTSGGNLLTIVITRCDRRLRSRPVSSMHISSLATADLLVGSVVMTFMLLYTVTFDGRWVFGRTLCTVWTVIDYISCTASLTNVVLIAVDRYRALSQPLKAIRHRSWRRTIASLLAAWLVPTLYWLAVVCAVKWYRRGQVVDVPAAAVSTLSVEQCDTDWDPPAVVIVSVIIMFYCPLVAIFVLFALIMNVLRYHAMTFAGGRMCQSATQSHLEAAGGGTEMNGPLQSQPVAIQQSASLERLSAGPSTGCQHRYDESAAAGNDRHARLSPNSSPVGYALHRSSRYHHDVAATPTCSRDRVILERDEWDSVTSSSKEMTMIRISVYGGGRRSTRSPRLRDGGGGGCSSNDYDDDDRYGALDASKRGQYARQLRAERHENMKYTRLRQQVRAGKTLAAITGFLLLCWMPFSIMLAIGAFCPLCISQRTFDIAIWINYINSAINPIIYCLCNAQYRQAMKMQLQRVCCFCRCCCFRHRTARLSI